MPKESNRSKGGPARTVDQRETFRFVPTVKPQARPSDIFNGAVGTRALTRARELKGLTQLMTQGTNTTLGILERRDAAAGAEATTSALAGGERPEGTPGFFNTTQVRQQAFDRVAGGKSVIDYKERLAEIGARADLSDPDAFDNALYELDQEFLGDDKTKDYLSVFAPEAAAAQSQMRARYSQAAHKELIADTLEKSSAILGDAISTELSALVGVDADVIDSDHDAQTRLHDTDIDVSGIAAKMRSLGVDLKAQGATKAQISNALINAVGIKAVRLGKPELMDVFSVPDPDDNGTRRSDLPQLSPQIEQYRRQAQDAQDRLPDQMEREGAEEKAKALKLGVNTLYSKHLDLYQEILKAQRDGYSPREIRARFGGDIAVLTQDFNTFRQDNIGDLSSSFTDNFQGRIEALFNSSRGDDTSGDREVLARMAKFSLEGRTPENAKQYDEFHDRGNFGELFADRVSPQVFESFVKLMEDTEAKKAGTLSAERAAELKNGRAILKYLKGSNTGSGSRGGISINGISMPTMGDEPETPREQAMREAYEAYLPGMALKEGADPEEFAEIKASVERRTADLTQRQDNTARHKSLMEAALTDTHQRTINSFYTSNTFNHLMDTDSYTSLPVTEQKKFARDILNLPVDAEARNALIQGLGLPRNEMQALSKELVNQVRAVNQLKAMQNREFTSFDDANGTQPAPNWVDTQLQEDVEKAPNWVDTQLDADATALKMRKDLEDLQKAAEGLKILSDIDDANQLDADTDSLLQLYQYQDELQKAAEGLKILQDSTEILSNEAELKELHRQVQQADEAIRVLEDLNAGGKRTQLGIIGANIIKINKALKAYDDSATANK